MNIYEAIASIVGSIVCLIACIKMDDSEKKKI